MATLAVTRLHKYLSVARATILTTSVRISFEKPATEGRLYQKANNNARITIKIMQNALRLILVVIDDG